MIELGYAVVVFGSRCGWWLGLRTEQLDAANLGEHLLGKDLIAGDVLKVALRHFGWLLLLRKPRRW